MQYSLAADGTPIISLFGAAGGTLTGTCRTFTDLILTGSAGVNIQLSNKHFKLDSVS
jgi:hypothetical protein